MIEAIVKSALGMFDARNGGFGQAPKFPHPGVLDLLMEHYQRTGDEQEHWSAWRTEECTTNWREGFIVTR